MVEQAMWTRYEEVNKMWTVVSCANNSSVVEL